MSPEEFDNRLRASFKDEQLPPREQLWQNVSARLDQNPGGSVWRWAAPVIIAVIVGLTWIGTSLLSNKKENSAPVSSVTTHTDSTTIVLAQSTETNSTDVAPVENNPSNESAGSSALRSENPTNSMGETSANSNSGASSSSALNNEGSNSSETTRALDNQSNTGLNNRNFSRHASTNPQSNSGIQSNPLGDEEFSLSTLSVTQFKPFANAVIEKPEVTRFDFISGLLHKSGKKVISIAERKKNAILNSGDFSDVKWFLNFGIGQQISYNIGGDINKDSSEYFHKNLYKHGKQLSGTGGGFNIHSTATRRFGKNKMFNIEFGLQYSRHREIIGMNENTVDIKMVDSASGKILYYINAQGSFKDPQGNTNYFELTEGFSYARRNTYNIFTVPFRFNVEQPLTPNTFVSLGIGGGMSYILGTSTGHYNLRRQSEMLVTNHQFSGNVNTMLQVYTNYNATMQVGFYTGYQMYLNKYNIANQYKIKMRDLQFGITCKVPLDYH